MVVDKKRKGEENLEKKNSNKEFFVIDDLIQLSSNFITNAS